MCVCVRLKYANFAADFVHVGVQKSLQCNQPRCSKTQEKKAKRKTTSSSSQSTRGITRDWCPPPEKKKNYVFVASQSITVTNVDFSEERSRPKRGEIENRKNVN